eukprot:IDg20251t1
MEAVIHTIRMDYESELLSEITWISGVPNPANALTKLHSSTESIVLGQLFLSGKIPIGADDLRGYGPALTKEE